MYYTKIEKFKSRLKFSTSEEKNNNRNFSIFPPTLPCILIITYTNCRDRCVRAGGVCCGKNKNGADRGG